ncbi:Zn finger protein HypA/HybF involved in hydrogenase expression [Dyella japonica]|uniref:Zn finger protein HypA/HybF involved in hydrogenase expression n=2 Tax=Dyella japonica TaxID=231455 RepID=A0ABV2JYK5_9GAMM
MNRGDAINRADTGASRELTSLRQSDSVALRELREAAQRWGFTLVTPTWHGAAANYLFRCAQGHALTRGVGPVRRGTVTCPQCAWLASKAQLLDQLKRRGITCDEAALHSLSQRHRFMCTHGHAWMTQLNVLRQGSGCPACARQRESARRTLSDGLERLRQAAAAHGGRCLDTTYRGGRVDYAWVCAVGHHWRARGHRVLQGAWCRTCADQQRGLARRDAAGLARLQAAAAAHGGRCLADTYEGVNVKYRFQCDQGHTWQTLGALVVAGMWCRRCAGRRRALTIEAMQAAAARQGGRCLSHTYVNTTTKLTWQCQWGHVWHAVPNNILYQNAWCPNCARLRVTKHPLRRQRYDVRG